jgi:hypothetical protein
VLNDATFLSDITDLSTAFEVLYAAAYIVGEYSEYVLASLPPSLSLSVSLSLSSDLLSVRCPCPTTPQWSRRCCASECMHCRHTSRLCLCRTRSRSTHALWRSQRAPARCDLVVSISVCPSLSLPLSPLVSRAAQSLLGGDGAPVEVDSEAAAAAVAGIEPVLRAGLTPLIQSAHAEVQERVRLSLCVSLC